MATTVGAQLDVVTLVKPYEAVAVGAVASLPVLPDRGVPIRGFRLPHGIKTSFYFLVNFTATSVMATGIKVDLAIVMDPETGNQDLTGTKAYLDGIATAITSGTTTADDAAFASSTAVAAQTAALPTAEDKILIHTITLPTTDNNSLAVDKWGLIRIRRLGDNASDTNLGTIVVVGVSVYGY